MVDKGIVFMILAIGCIWLVIDQLVGKKLISQFVTMILSSVSEE
jgi:predicted type IV restriction endonuclease